MHLRLFEHSKMIYHGTINTETSWPTEEPNSRTNRVSGALELRPLILPTQRPERPWHAEINPSQSTGTYA